MSVFIAARCYTSAVYAMALCLSVCVCVCPSQVGVLLKWLDGSSRFLTWRLPSTYPTLCYKGIRVTPKISILLFGTLSKMLDVEIFITAAGQYINKDDNGVLIAPSPYKPSSFEGAANKSRVRFGLSFHA